MFKRLLFLLGLPLAIAAFVFGRRMRQSGAGGGGHEGIASSESDLPPIEWDGTLPQDLLEILACPKCKSPLSYEQDERRLVCIACKVYYPVRDGIPILLIEEARPLEPAAAGGQQTAGSES